MKTCSKCKVPKECSEFYARSKSSDGLRSACKACELADVPTHKICSRCKLLKLRSDFYRRADRGPFAVMSNCKTCQDEKHLKFMESPAAKESDRRRHNETYAKDPESREKSLTRSKARSQRFPEENRKHKLKQQYGLTPEAFSALLTSQGGACAICSGPPNLRGKKNFCVDHDHKTGKIRGLLCGQCNVALGMLRDSPHFAASAAYYLAKHSL